MRREMAGVRAEMKSSLGGAGGTARRANDSAVVGKVACAVRNRGVGCGFRGEPAQSTRLTIEPSRGCAMAVVRPLPVWGVGKEIRFDAL
jgi:hypothetical protein